MEAAEKSERACRLAITDTEDPALFEAANRARAELIAVLEQSGHEG